MPLAERIARHSAMLAVIKDNDIHRWQERFIADLKEIEPGSEESHLRARSRPSPNSPERSRLALSALTFFQTHQQHVNAAAADDIFRRAGGARKQALVVVAANHQVNAVLLAKILHMVGNSPLAIVIFSIG
jgi:uncharacterized protein related to proFAR isomerase